MNKVSENVIDFIGVYEHALDRSLCETLMDTVDRLLERESIDRSQQFRDKFDGDDLSVFFHTTMIATQEHGGVPGLAELDQTIHDCTIDYIDNFPVFRNELKNYHMKFQKTEPTQGYHVWHSENSAPVYRGRDLVWTVFLNDIAEGGETEFLYQKRRVPARQGSVLIFPASFTHTHRGNPPLSGTKYIATGWWTTCETE